MPSHNRAKSRGSLSMLSFDGIRPFKRTSSRQAISTQADHDFGRSPSSLSYCDPYDQPPAAPAVAEMATQDDVRNDENIAPGQAPRKRRPLSWLSFGRNGGSSGRSFSQRVQILRNPSSTSLARSTISAPVLTSTTNVKVAESEGVHCGELTPEMFNKSTWDGKIGWVPQEDEASAESAETVVDGARTESNVPRRRDDAPSRLGRAIKDRFRNPSRASRRSFSLLRDEGSMDSDGRAEKLSHYRAETMNYCKDKLRSITASHSSITTSSAPGARQLEASPERPLLKAGNVLSPQRWDTTSEQDERSPTSPQLPTNTAHSPSQFDSLTRSLNNILDKELTDENNEMEYLKKKASKYGLRADYQAAPPVPEVPDLPPRLIPRDPVALSPARQHDHVKLPTSAFIESTPTRLVSPTTSRRLQKKDFNAISPKNENEPVTHIDDGIAKLRTLKRSPAKSDDVIAAAARMNRINPLGMHSNVMGMAQAPPGVTLPKPGLPYPKQLESNDEYPKTAKEDKKLDFGTVLSGQDGGHKMGKSGKGEMDSRMPTKVASVSGSNGEASEHKIPRKAVGSGMKKSISRLFHTKKTMPEEELSFGAFLEESDVRKASTKEDEEKKRRGMVFE
ncbi:uncharacterized protein AB675_4411 [Cyphellophora attinorum]|uniref:Uncharacterized protein n=1 Tax=Cyphellophora attinorum TaxID=1664694 RepID=A0A0N1HNB7_9EURO|nr:uncharacterized protein AB675_4411 [Phialophora attinorum]KPI36503.1 hypothetical protein AB675_4411 [Phialophora attinorum]